MSDHLTPDEAKRLEAIEAALAKVEPLKAEKRAILSRARVRAHYHRKKAAMQS